MAFPTTGTLDNFNRTNEGPPPSASWTTIYNGHKVVSNRIAGNTADDANVSQWEPTYGNDQEAYITLTTGGIIANLYIRINMANATGYAVGIEGDDSIHIYRVDELGVTEVLLGAAITGNSFATGDSLGAEIIGSTIKAYKKPSGGSWAEIGSRTDSTYSSGDTIVYFCYSTSTADDFGGGTVVASGASGTLSQTLGAVTVGATGVLALTGTLAQTLAAVTSTATGTLPIVGTLAVTLADATLAATGAGSAPIAGTLDVTLDAVTSTSTGTLAIVGTLAVTLDPATLSATGKLAIAATASPTLDAAVVAATGYILTNACVNGVLTVNATNGRYVENGDGPLILAGYHTWYETQDGGPSDPPPPFDWDEFLGDLVAKGVNFTKLWRMETAREWPTDDTQVFGVQPYARTGPGSAADGHLKFDLDTWDTNYFERLLQRAITAGNAGLYVCVQFYNGFHIDSAGKPDGGVGDPWAYHPFASANNINSVDGDIDNDGVGEELRDTSQTALYNRAKAYVEKVIDTLGHLDNVIWEIANEDTYSSTDVTWQHDLIDHIHTYEAGKAKQHLVGMTKLYPGGSNTDLTTSNADWISPDDDLDPDAVTSTSFVRMYDTDHAVGVTDTYDWIMRAFARGYGGAWYMDVWDSDWSGLGDTIANATYVKIRSILGYALDYAARIDLANATPQGSLASTGYCLAKLTGLFQFFVYQDGTGDFTVNLTSYAGTFTLEWLRIDTGTVQAGSDVGGGAVRTLTPPWSGEVAAFLELAGADGTLSVTLADATLTATGVLAIVATAAATLADATLSAAGALAGVGTLTGTLQDATLAAVGTLPIVGTLAGTLADATLSAAGVVAIIATAGATLDAVTLAASGVSLGVGTGALSVTLEAVTLSATGILPIVATGAITLSDASLSATGTLAIVAVTDVTLESATLTASGRHDAYGTLAVTLADATLAAIGIEVILIAAVAGSVRGVRSTGTIAGVKSTGSVRG